MSWDEGLGGTVEHAATIRLPSGSHWFVVEPTGWLARRSESGPDLIVATGVELALLDSPTSSGSRSRTDRI